MFKRDNEQEEKYAHSQHQQQQQQQKMRGTSHQYGQYKNPMDQYHSSPYRQYKNDATTTSAGDTYDAANIRMRHFQQQQQRMHHIQNVNSHKQAYQKSMSSPLSSIPETYPRSPGTSANFQNISINEHVSGSTNAPSSPGLSAAFNSHISGNVRQSRNNLAEEDDNNPSCISNVMEGLINVAESVVASKSSTSSEFGVVNDTLHQEGLQPDLSTCL